MNRFLALMHDKMVPQYLREYIDASTIDVPTDQLLKAAHDIFMEKRLAMFTSDDEEVAVNPQDIIHKWIKSLEKTNNVESSEPQELNEHDFILNFLQKKKLDLVSEEDQRLAELGLSTNFALNKERRQRA